MGSSTIGTPLGVTADLGGDALPLAFAISNSDSTR
jgi:hypothetical protein